MTANAFCIARIRALGISSKTIRSHAMSFNLLPAALICGTRGSCIGVFAPLTMGDSGISVPISRGGPPIFSE